MQSIRSINVYYIIFHLRDIYTCSLNLDKLSLKIEWKK